MEKWKNYKRRLYFKKLYHMAWGITSLNRTYPFLTVMERCRLNMWRFELLKNYHRSKDV